MTTLSTMRTNVARRIRDTGFATFSTAQVNDFINDGIVEVSRLAPKQFQENITVVADTMEYTLQTTASQEVSLTRVEIWDASATPDRFAASLIGGSGETNRSSAAGWRVWGGKLYLTNGQENILVPGTHILRVWGYRPYANLSADADVFEGSIQAEFAIYAYCRLEAYRSLAAERSLFTQWQVDSHNTDTSPTQLQGALNLAEDDWRRRSGRLFAMREVS